LRKLLDTFLGAMAKLMVISIGLSGGGLLFQAMGALGVRLLCHMNEALKTKWLWHFCQSGGCSLEICYQCQICVEYFGLVEQEDPRCSWRGLLEVYLS